MAKNLMILGSLFLMTACSSARGPMVSYNEFIETQTGTKVNVLEESLGEPYAIHKRKDGSYEYEYIERIDGANGLIAENHYFFIVQGDEVVGKYMKRQTPPAYNEIYEGEPNYRDYEPQ